MLRSVVYRLRAYARIAFQEFLLPFRMIGILIAWIWEAAGASAAWINGEVAPDGANLTESLSEQFRDSQRHVKRLAQEVRSHAE